MPRLTFGKYAHYELCDVPREYLRWLLAQSYETVRDIEQELGERSVERSQRVTALDLSAATHDVQRAVITGVSREDRIDGSVGIAIALSSTDMDLQTMFFLHQPREFVADIKIDPSTLSDFPRRGTRMSPKEEYGTYVRNTMRTAVLQKLLTLASEQDRQASVVPDTFDELVAVLSDLLTDLPCVFTRRNDGHQLIVFSIESISTVDNPKIKRYVKRWQERRGTLCSEVIQ